MSLDDDDLLSRACFVFGEDGVREYELEPSWSLRRIGGRWYIYLRPDAEDSLLEAALAYYIMHGVPYAFASEPGSCIVRARIPPLPANDAAAQTKSDPRAG